VGVDEPVYILHATFTEFLLGELGHHNDSYEATNVYAINKAVNWIELGAINKVLAKYMLSLSQLQSSMEQMLKLSIYSVVSLSSGINLCVLLISE